jgi:hypothetical protein
MWKRLPVLLLGLAPLVVGCGDDDENPPKEPLSALRGVYPMDSWTRNEMACDVEGPSQLEAAPEKLLGVGTTEFFIYDILVAIPCADDQDCADSVDGGVFAALAGGATFGKGQGSDAAGWESGSFGYTVTDNQCQGRYVKARLSQVAEGQLELVQEGYDVAFPAEAPENADDRCPLETAQELAKALPCLSLERIVGTFARALPEPSGD